MSIDTLDYTRQGKQETAVTSKLTQGKIKNHRLFSIHPARSGVRGQHFFSLSQIGFLIALLLTLDAFTAHHSQQWWA